MRKTIISLLFCILMIISLTGCDYDFEIAKLVDTTPSTQHLIKVGIYFTDGEFLEGYVKSLEIEDNGKVYMGGSSVNYLYNREGTVIGIYNYQRVLYILILEEENEE